MDTYTDAMDSISATGQIWGYNGGILLIIITMVVVGVVGFHNILPAIAAAMFVQGLWWCLFTIPAVLHIRKRAGPPLPGNQNVLNFLWFSLKRSVATLRAVNHIPQTRNFMISYFLYTDAVSTISQAGVIFTIDELGMDLGGLIILVFLAPFMAMLGKGGGARCSL